MNKTLHKIGLILSPFIAIYGTIPLYLFNRVEFFEASILFWGLSINIFITYFCIIYLINRFPTWNDLLLFTSSFIVSIVTRIAIGRLIKFFVNTKGIIHNHDFIYQIITAFAINVILIVVIKSILTANLKKDLEQHLQEVKLENAEVRMKVLMQQLQPHFIFNSLSILKSMIAEEPISAEKYVVRLGEFLRYAVQAPNSELVSLENELRFVIDYIELQKERFEDAFNYKIEIDNRLYSMQLPVMALQTVVENIFKHNYFTKQKPLFFTIKNENENIVVENQKISLRLTERSQTGLANLQKRFELLVCQPILIEESEATFIVKLPLLPK